MQDVAKKVPKSRKAMWEAIADARAGFVLQNPNIAIELMDWLPEMEVPTVEPAYMPGN